MSFCSNSAILSKYEPGINIHPLKCRCWTCEECREDRKSRLKREAFRGKPEKLLTLTVNPAWGDGISMRARALVEAWRKIRRSAKDHWGNKKIPFLAVFEETKEGEPHLHILLRAKWIPQTWISDRMAELMDAPIVHITQLNSKKKAARYVSKYIGKNPERFEGCKRYWRSLDWFVIPEKPRVNPLGEPLSKWWEPGKVADIVRKYCRKFYREVTFDLSNHKEYWLADDWPNLKQDGEIVVQDLQLFGSAPPGASGRRGGYPWL